MIDIDKTTGFHRTIDNMFYLFKNGFLARIYSIRELTNWMR